jgi:hypothetical protein
MATIKKQMWGKCGEIRNSCVLPTAMGNDAVAKETIWQFLKKLGREFYDLAIPLSGIC